MKTYSRDTRFKTFNSSSLSALENDMNTWTSDCCVTILDVSFGIRNVRGLEVSYNEYSALITYSLDTEQLKEEC